VREVRCPACGEAFSCGADEPASAPCWCVQVTIPKPALDALAVTYDGCLCPTCLAATAATAGPGRTDSS
jgi:hypothetical protein